MVVVGAAAVAAGGGCSLGEERFCGDEDLNDSVIDQHFPFPHNALQENEFLLER